MAIYTVSFHWGDTIELDVGDGPESPICVDGMTTPWQFAEAQCYVEQAIELVVDWWGRDFYGYEPGDRRAALEHATWERSDDDDEEDDEDEEET